MVEGSDPKAKDVKGIANLTKYEDKKQYPDRYPRSRESIGIEVVGAYINSTTMEPATPAQSARLKDLVHGLQTRYSLTDSDVFTHAQISYKQGNEGQGLYGP